MIYLFSGDDIKKKRFSYENFIKSIPKEIETFFINKNDFSPMEVESFYRGSGLFFKKCVVVFVNIFEKKETLDFVLDKLDLMSESDNDFIFLEGKLNKPILDAFKKTKTTINNFELSKDKKEKFNNFLLADAFEQRNKLELWIYFRQAIDKGVGMEELIGVLFWKAKDLLLKSKFNKFTETELKKFIGEISFLLPEARKKGEDAETMFEKFLLEAF